MENARFNIANYNDFLSFFFLHSCSSDTCSNLSIQMDALDELLHKFGGLSVNDSESNDDKPTVTESTTEKQNYESAPWMKQFTFIHILLPIHDAIYPNETFNLDEKKHQEIFNAIDINNDGFISQYEFLKVTSLSSEQCVIPIQRLYELFTDINSENNKNGISFDLWMKAVSNIKLESIQNNSQKQVNDNKDNDENKSSNKEHLLSVHIITCLKCIDNVWKQLGPAHRESAYQKAFLFELMDNGYKVLMEKRVPVYHYTKFKKKIHLVSMERIDLYIKYPATVIEMKAVASKLSVKDEYQTKKYSKNRKYLSFLINCPNNRDDMEVKCWTVGDDDMFYEHDITQYK
eukprot:261490_1